MVAVVAVVEIVIVHLVLQDQQDLAVVELVDHKTVIMQQQEQRTLAVVVVEVVKTNPEKMVVVV